MNATNNPTNVSRRLITVFISIFTLVISVGSFMYCHGLHIIEAYYPAFILGSFIVLLLCFLLSREPSNCVFSIPIGIAAFAIFALSLISRHRVKETDAEAFRQELLYDATIQLGEALSSSICDEDDKLAIKNDVFIYVLVPVTESKQEFVRRVIDATIMINDTLISNSALTFGYQALLSDEGSLQAKYYAIGLNKYCLKDGWENERCSLLPVSVSHFLKGFICLQEYRWKEAKREFELADSLGNAAGTFYLAKWYESGYEQDPDVPKSHSLYRKAADNGSRDARCSFASVLKDSTASLLQKTLAENYLKKAAVLSTVATLSGFVESLHALGNLNEYYNATARFQDAYELTLNSYSSFPNELVKYIWHLKNCVNCKKYDEAIKIIKEGEEKGQPSTFLIHAAMLSRSEGVDRNLEKAKDLLSYAVDSLDYWYAFKGLADLYNEAGLEDEGLWKKLFDVKFSHTIDTTKSRTTDLYIHEKLWY